MSAAQPKASLLGGLAVTASAVGPGAALLALTNNEELTNAAYDTALDLAVDDATRATLERNFHDEQRHIEWLNDLLEDANDDAGEEVEAQGRPA